MWEKVNKNTRSGILWARSLKINPFRKIVKGKIMPGIEEFTLYIGTNYMAMRTFLALLFAAVLMILMYSVPVSAGVITAIFWPKRLPPFGREMRNWTLFWIRVWGGILFGTALMYVMYRWEASEDPIHALFVVFLPLIVLYLYRDAKYADIAAVLMFGGAYLAVLAFTLWQSYEFRVSMAISVASITSTVGFWKLWIFIKSQYDDYPKARASTAIATIIMITVTGIMYWISETYLYHERPVWDDILLVIFIACMAVIIIPWVVIGWRLYMGRQY